MTIMLDEADRLQAIESLIQKMNYARKQPGTRAHVQWLALRAAAADLRARQSATIHHASMALETVLVGLSKTRDSAGRPNDNQARMVAETINGFWPVVRQALVAFAQRKPDDDPEGDGYEDRVQARAHR
jgi:hypothetical protein